MSLQTKAQLNTAATTVTNETVDGANDEARVGGLFTNIVDSMLHAALLQLANPQTLAQITANQNDYAVTQSYNRVSSDAARSITGVVLTGASSHIVVFSNVGAFAITFVNASASSAAANRFALAADLVLGAGKACAFLYDATQSRWVLLIPPRTILSNSNPVAPANTATPGTADEAARQDHVHPIPLPSIVTEATTARTLQLSDANNIIRTTSGSATSITVPPNSSVAFPIGTTILVRQAGAGLVTLVQGSGVTLNGSSLVSAGQHATLSITKIAADTWDVGGKTAA